MPGITIGIRSDTEITLNILALVFADMHWDEFSKFIAVNGQIDEKDIRNDIQHIIAHELHNNSHAIRILFAIMGEDELIKYVEELTGKEMEDEH
jgi:hypothetical protein